MKYRKERERERLGEIMSSVSCERNGTLRDEVTISQAKQDSAKVLHGSLEVNYLAEGEDLF